jgi:hypothetical protein
MVEKYFYGRNSNAAIKEGRDAHGNSELLTITQLKVIDSSLNGISDLNRLS